MCCLVRSHILQQVFYRDRKRRCFVGMRCQGGCSALLKKTFSSVYVCLCKVCLCERVCVWDCFKCASLVFSQRSFTANHLSPLARLSCGGKNTWNIFFLLVLRGFQQTNEVWVCWSKRCSFRYSVLKCLEHFKRMCICFSWIPVVMFYFRIKLFTWACAFSAKWWKSGAKQTVATMGIYEKKENEYLPRHHCTTQHLCLIALGLPAPAVTRKDRKTGWQDTEMIHS